MDEGNDCHEPPPSKRAQVSEHSALIQRSARAIAALSARLDELDSSRREVLCKIDEHFAKLRAGLDDLENGVRRELENVFREEDDRIQDAIVNVREQLGKKKEEEEEGEGGESGAWVRDSLKAVEAAELGLLVRQTYALECKDLKDPSELCSLKVHYEVAPESVQLRPPRPAVVEGAYVALALDSVTPEEREVLKAHEICDPFSYKVAFSKRGSGVWAEREYRSSRSAFYLGGFFPEAESEYEIKAKTVLNGEESEWSEVVLLAVPPLSKSCFWKKCPKEAERWKRYVVDKSDPRIVTKVDARGYGVSTVVVGSVSLPLGKASSWGVRLLSSGGGSGVGIYVGVAPSDIDLNNCRSYDQCGWYFYCYGSKLWSGPPHNYKDKEYGPRKIYGEYVHIGGIVDLVMDTAKGDLSFIVDGVNLGVAYEEIPLDKPLVPCVLLLFEGDSVELVDGDAETSSEKGDSTKRDECVLS